MREWLAARARADPDSLALIDTGSNTRLTYRELDDRVDGFAASLASSGVGPEDRVGTLLPRGETAVTMLWAILRVGATIVPLDVQETPDTIASAIERAGIDQLVVDDSTADVGRSVASESHDVFTVGDSRKGIPKLDRETGGTAPTSIMGRDETRMGRDETRMGRDETRVILFTSGTSGEPKGVRLTPRNLGASAAGSAFRLGVEPDDRWLLTLPTYHMGGLSIPIRATIYGTAVVVEPEFDPAETAAAMTRYGVTGVSLVPTMLRRLLDADWEPEGLRFALVGGAPTPTDLAQRALDRGVPLYTTYGMTETGSQVATATPEDLREQPDTVGRPLRTASVSILDDDGNPVADRTGRGEIHVSGPIVSPGYLDESSRSDRDGFRTGDVGYLDEAGRLFVEGRRDDVIISGGENVDPREVEEAIRSHPAVSAAIVLGVPDDEWGERVGAVVVASDGLDADGLGNYLEAELAPYKIPKSITVADHLPRTRSGTVDRESARARLLRSRDDDAGG